MSATVSKARRLLDVDEHTARFVSFAGEHGDGSVAPTYIEVDRQTFDDMGSPTEITVTIEPGDRLNDEDHRNEKGYL